MPLAWTSDYWLDARDRMAWLRIQNPIDREILKAEITDKAKEHNRIVGLLFDNGFIPNKLPFQADGKEIAGGKGWWRGGRVFTNEQAVQWLNENCATQEDRMSKTQQVRTVQQPASAPTKPAQAPPEFDPNAAIIDSIMERTINNLDSIADRYARELADPAIGRMRRAVVMAQAINLLRMHMTDDVMKILMDLMNTDSGFKTDRGPHAYRDDMKTPYGYDVVKECAVQALLQGVMWTGNEFNIISGRCYLTKEGYQRKLAETEGLTDLRWSTSAPYIRDGKTLVTFCASWKYRGKLDSLINGKNEPGHTFEIVSNKFSGPDQIVGKAIRKGLKRVFEQIHGSTQAEDDPEVREADVETEADKLKKRLDATAANAANATTTGPSIADQINAEFERIGTSPETIKTMLGRHDADDASQLSPKASAALLAELKKIPSREPGSDDE